MNTNFFSEYGFDTNDKFVSKLDKSGFSCPTQQSNKYEKSAIESFFNNNYDTNVAILQPEFVAGNLCTTESEIKEGGNVILGKTLEIKEPIILANGDNLSVNLNEGNIVAGVFAESNGQVTEGDTDSYAFWVKEGGMLSIDGQGEVVAQDAKYSMAVWAQGGTVTIKGGKFFNGGDGCDLIYVSNGGKVYIYGGEFHASNKSGAESGTLNKRSALNIKDADRAISKIVVYGGKFYGFDPANNVSEGANTNFVADGYVSVEVEADVFEVRKA